MIVLKISNASELVASKLGKFLESLTPDAFDESTVEDVLIQKMVENLKIEGLKGEIASVKGMELEAGTVPVKGFSAYTSLTYTSSVVDKDMPSSATAFYATANKQYPDTPRVMGALSLQYTNGPVLLNLAGKYTGLRYLTMVNDVSIGGFSTLDFNAAYKLPSDGFFKNPVLRFNVSNLTNKQYLTASLGSGSSIAINAAGNPYVYPGAPRFFSMTGQADF